MTKLDFSPGIRNRVPLGLLLLGILCLFYFVPNKVQFFVPLQVDRTPLDDLIQLWPMWIWFYVGCYFFVIWIFLVAKSAANAKCIFWSLVLAAFISSLIFILFPTAIDRGRYPILGQGLNVWLLQLIRAADNSVNCFPSMHIAMSVIATFGYYLESKKSLILAVAFTVGVTISTMATKQHYFYDVLGGFAVGLFAWLWVQWRIAHPSKEARDPA